MPNTNAFTYYINPIGSGQDENNTVHEVSPSWVITFVRWRLRDTLRTKPTPNLNYQTLRSGDPLVVENDCVSVSTSFDKATLTDSMSATFKITDTNYETAVEPGDFVFVNMLNWEEDSRRVALQALAKKPINGPVDGFKGVYKVQGVRKILGVDPQTGKKAFYVKITGYSFTEMNNVIYFNPELIFSNEKTNLLLYVSNIANNWKLLQNNKGITNIQDIVEALIDSFLGTGIGDLGKTVKGTLIKSFNTLFFIPSLVGNLLNVKNAKASKDIYNFLFGIQSYAAGAQQVTNISLQRILAYSAQNPNVPASTNTTNSPGTSAVIRTLSTGMNPSNFQSNNSRVWKPSDIRSKCQGETYTKPEYWNQVKVWSIFNQWANSPLNEMYTCFKISSTGYVMPTMVFRQIPFTNTDFQAGSNRVTRFLNIPRWKIHPALLTGFDVGRDDSARVNFVQYYGRSTLSPQGYDISVETAQGNYLYDIDDVKRSGLRPQVYSTTFDEQTPNKPDLKSPQWAKIVGDALIGGHLKFNGTITTAGIIDAITVGDNLELDGTVYHIERVTHTCGIDPESGNKTFRSSFGLSMGISVDSSTKGLAYSEMSYSNAYKLRQVDGSNTANHLLPGVAESQDTVYRPDPGAGTGAGLDYKHQINPPSDGFKQPNNNTSVTKTGVENEAKETVKK